MCQNCLSCQSEGKAELTVARKTILLKNRKVKKFLLFLFLASCSGTSVRNFDHIPGGLSATQVQNEIRKSFPTIRSCYEKSASFRKKIMGRILVSFRIEERGNVTEASVAETSFREKNLHICILEKVKDIQFPPPVGGGYVDVSYPFHFRVQSKAPADKIRQRNKKQ